VTASAGPAQAYRRLPDEAPSRTLAWNVYGAGLDHVGRGGLPEPVPVGRPASDQILVRVDAVGLCFSDVKLIRLGGEHPKLYGRTLATEPTRLGHEVTVTVVEVGEGLTGRFHRGQRLAVQPDIYVDGRSAAYGYTVPGGLIGYHLMGPEVLDADDGAYVIEVDDRLGFAEAALTEPWACVEAAYTQRRRLVPLAGGRAWVIGRRDDDRRYDVRGAVSEAAEIVASNVRAELVDSIRDANPSADVTVADVDSVTGEFDDVVMLGPRSASFVGRAADALAFRGLLNLVGHEPLDGLVEIDIGRLHYHYIAYVGTTDTDVAAAYGEERNRAELRPDGVAVVVGAAGPMGQMHVERALRMRGGPRLVVGVDVDPARLEIAAGRLGPVADDADRELVMTVAGDGLSELVARLTDGLGADDVIVTAPSAQAVIDASAAMAPDGMLVLFAGVPVGTRAVLDLSPVFMSGAQYTGTSGSRILDQARVVDKTLDGMLAPGRALAAIGSIEAAAEGLEALMNGTIPGKIVIFPQLRGLPLTTLDTLARRDPAMRAALADDGTWTVDAESRLFERYGASAGDP
jgi:L-sorbose 1-phosphate reductase